MSNHCIMCLRGLCAACKARMGVASCECSHARDTTGIGGASNLIADVSPLAGPNSELSAEQLQIASRLGVDFNAIERSEDKKSEEDLREADNSDSLNDGDTAVKPKRIRRQKADGALRNATATGRARAAKLYPLHKNDPCEWSTAGETKPFGGGAVPVTKPCTGVQQARHHGPDKNTLNNDVGNVHRICDVHHIMWHAQNDAAYDQTKPLKD